jgi:hypothetical protein
MVFSLDQLKNWDWCGHGFLLGEKNSYCEQFQNREESFRRFGDNETDAIEAYLNRKHRKADYTYVLETISNKVCAEYGVAKDES